MQRELHYQKRPKITKSHRNRIFFSATQLLMITVLKIVVYLTEILKQIRATFNADFKRNTQNNEKDLYILLTGEQFREKIYMCGPPLRLWLTNDHEMTAAFQPAVWCCPFEYVILSNQEEAKAACLPSGFLHDCYRLLQEIKLWYS